MFYNGGGIEQISVQFTLVDQKFTDVTFSGINYKDGNYLEESANSVQRRLQLITKKQRSI